ENGPRPWGLRDLLIGTVAALVVVAAAASLTRGPGGDPHPPPSPAPVASDSLLPSPTLASAPIGAAQESDSPAATERAAVVLPSQAPGGPRYGSNVDVAEAVPPPFQQPGQLPVRPTGTPVTAAGGTYGLPDANSTGGDWFLKRRGDNVTMQGTGYLRVFWGIFFADGRVATMTMPTWTGLSGRLFHVASGGGHRMDDARPATAGVQPGQTWMGSPGTGFDRLPGGAQQMWGFEYYYLDGQVTLHNNEWNTDYDLAVQPESAGDISTELGTRPGTDYDYVRYGLVRDTGTDGAPVPQYVTRATPADPTTVAQHSQV
ncbi:MAG TPA: hypothetical protein VJT31_39470, partial [Rugosimonospora sp.]|nr:hypothetical protein [Rugosimonospora sp.]